MTISPFGWRRDVFWVKGPEMTILPGEFFHSREIWSWANRENDRLREENDAAVHDPRENQLRPPNRPSRFVEPLTGQVCRVYTHLYSKHLWPDSAPHVSGRGRAEGTGLLLCRDGLRDTPLAFLSFFSRPYPPGPPRAPEYAPEPVPAPTRATPGTPGECGSSIAQLAPISDCGS